MRRAEILAGVVINVIVIDPDNMPDWCASWPECPEAGPGWTWNGKTYAPPQPAEG